MIYFTSPCELLLHTGVFFFQAQSNRHCWACPCSRAVGGEWPRRWHFWTSSCFWPGAVPAGLWARPPCLQLLGSVWSDPYQLFLSFLLTFPFSALLQLHKSSRMLSAPCWGPRRVEALWLMDAEKHTGLWQYSAEIIKVFFWNYSDKLDLFWTRVGQLAVAVGLKQPPPLPSHWWVSWSLVGNDKGTGIHSLFVSRWAFWEQAFALSWMEAVGLLPDPMWTWNLQCFIHVMLVLMSHVRRSYLCICGTDNLQTG